MAKMQILGADVNRKTFTISASQTAFPFDFPFFQDEDIRVIHVSDAGVETEKVLTTDFTVTGNVVDEGFQGGQVDLLVAVTDGTVAVFTDTTIERLTSHKDAGPFDTRVLNKDVLKLYQINKEQNIAIDRGIKLSDADQSTALQLDDPATRASKILGFDATGLNLAYYTGSIDISLTPVTAYAATILDDINAAAARTTLELGDAATKTVGVDDGEVLSATQASTDVASAATTNIGAAASLFVRITGTTTITAFDTVAAGLFRKVRFADALTLTHNGTSLILPGSANITTAADDTAEFVSLGSGNWFCLSYKRADGFPLLGRRVRQTLTSLTAGTTHDETGGITANTKRIEMQIRAMSTDGTSNIEVKLGDSGGIEESGYTGTQVRLAASSVVNAFPTDAFTLKTATAAAATHQGRIILELIDAATNTWSYQAIFFDSSNNIQIGVGEKSLSAALTTIRFVMANGTDQFDGGELLTTVFE